MTKNRSTEEQLISFHKQAEAGMPIKVHARITASPWSAIAAQPVLKS